MNELIKIENRDGINTVNARELHRFLEVGKVFGAWITDRINQFGFTEHQDFVIIEDVCFPNSESKGRGGHNKKDYHLTIDMAKELSMVERNEKGKQARQYFIECERVAKQKPAVDPMAILNDPSTMRTLLLTYSEKVIALEEEKKLLEPKAAALDRIATANGSLNITETAKSLQVRPKVLFQWLSANKWIYRRVGGKNWLAYQPKIQQGVLEHKITTVIREDGTEKIIEQVLVTPKGLSKLSEVFAQREAA